MNVNRFIGKSSCRDSLWAWSILIVFVFLLTPKLSEAQEFKTTIDSNPPGAFLTLDGEYEITATAPCRLPDNIIGSYKLKAKFPGYESWRGEITIIPGQNNSFSFSMKPKTRFKAGLRSIFIPGWGQYYSGSTTRSLIFGVGTIGLGVAVAYADIDFRDKRNDYEQAKIDLANARTGEEIDRLWNLARDKNRQAYDAENRRNTIMAAALGLWAYNVLDAIIFFPEHRLMGGLPRLQAGFDGDLTRISLTKGF